MRNVILALGCFALGLIACDDHDHDHDHDADADAALLDQASMAACTGVTLAFTPVTAGVDANTATTIVAGAAPYSITLPAGTGFIAVDIDEPHHDWLVSLTSGTIVSAAQQGGEKALTIAPNPTCPQLITAQARFHSHVAAPVILGLQGASPPTLLLTRVATDHSAPDAGDHDHDEDAGDHDHDAGDPDEDAGDHDHN